MTSEKEIDRRRHFSYSRARAHFLLFEPIDVEPEKENGCVDWRRGKKKVKLDIDEIDLNYLRLSDHRQWNMKMNITGTFGSLNDALKFVGLTSGLFLNETLVFRTANNRPTLSNSIPLILGIIGLIFNILALLIFTVSKTFRQSSFRCYIYAFVLVNCASILT